MFTSNAQFVCPCPRDGGKLSRLVYLAACPGFGSNSVISYFLLRHNFGIFSCIRYKHYFRQTEMFASNVQFDYPCPRGGGQAVQAGLSCPPRPGFGSGSVIRQFLLHHNLGIFSCMRYKHYFGQTEMFASNVQFGYPCPRSGGASCPGGFILLTTQDLSQTVSSVNSYCTIILEYLVVRDVNIISAKLRYLHPMFSLVTLVRGVGG